MDTIDEFSESQTNDASGVVLLRFATFDTPFGPMIKLADMKLADDLADELFFEHDGFRVTIVMSEEHRPTHGLRIERNAVTIITNRTDEFDEAYSFRFAALTPPANQAWIGVFEQTIKALNEAWEERGGIKFIE